MKEKMGYKTLILYGINSLVGSGVFLIPNQGMKMFGPASILILILDAVLALLISMCFAECASLFDEDGGAYIYAKNAFGDFVGYEVGFINWAVRIISQAVMLTAFATALGATFPELNSPLVKNIIIVTITAILIVINVCGVHAVSIVNNIVTVAKLIPILLVCFLGLFFLKGGNFTPFFVSHLTTMSNFSNTAVMMFFIFTGFETISIAAQDMENPEKNLPKVLLITVSTVGLIYVLVMISCIGVMGSKLADTTLPLQSVMYKICGSFGAWIVATGTFVSIGGILLGSSFVTPRAGVALAQNKMMPAVLSKTNKANSPYIAILISSLISMLLACSGSFITLAKISVVARFVQYIPTVLAVLVFRKTMPAAERTFKVPFGWTIPIIALLVSIFILAKTNWQDLALGCIALLIAMPFYFLAKHKNKLS